MREAKKADEPWMPVVVCIGDMGGGKPFYIHATSWFGGDTRSFEWVICLTHRS